MGNYPHVGSSSPVNGASFLWWITWLKKPTTNRRLSFPPFLVLQLKKIPISHWEPYDASVQVHFNARCAGADFKSHTVSFEDKWDKPVPYNLLVAADGARSIVRNEFIRQRGFDYQQTNMPYTFKVLYVPRPPELCEAAVHAFRWVAMSSCTKLPWLWSTPKKKRLSKPS
jgi:2-polyprenyl-6-methoxyphenol hydroxylase-like FAD-dependent oxidoreductase